MIRQSNFGHGLWAHTLDEKQPVIGDSNQAPTEFKQHERSKTRTNWKESKNKSKRGIEKCSKDSGEYGEVLY